VRLALAIGALAPKLRLGNILALERARHLDASLQFITVHQHKTVVKTRRPLVVPISEQLRAVLKYAQQRAPGRFVVSYRHKPVKSIRGGLRAAAKAAGVQYGRAFDNGVTFHTLRHTAATILAELDVSEAKRQSAMGHRHLATTQKYTHLRPMNEIPTIEALSAALPIVDLVTAPWRRASRTPAPKSAGDAAERGRAPRETAGRAGDASSSQKDE
jgi:integrase